MTDSFLVYIKTEDIYSDIENTSHYELDRPSPEGKQRKSNSINKRGIKQKIMTNIVVIKGKTYSYLTDDKHENKKSKGTKKICPKKKSKI